MADRNGRRRARAALAVGVALLAVLALPSGATTEPGGRVTEGHQSATVADGQRTTTGANTTDNRTAPAFDATVFRDIAGQVAVEDGSVAVRGTAAGTDEVLVALFDRRGRVVTETVSVDDDGTFEEDDLPLVTDDGTPLAEGRIVATVLAAGRDERVGDGEVGNATEADLGDFEAAFRETLTRRSGGRVVSRTQRQVVELYYDQTVEDSGSDDLLLAEEFVYTDARTSIERVFSRSAADGSAADRTTSGNATAPDNDTAPNNSTASGNTPTPDNATGPAEPIRVGDTLVVRGLTNRRPEDNTVFVEVVAGPSADAFDLAATDSWGTDGVWQVELDTAGVEPGVYTIEAEDGESSDSVRVRILPRGANRSRNATGGRHRRPSDSPVGPFA
ncbi:hypothetical protein M0R88_14765 [Halorussus gelatinilyticus]|uniref:Major cell surface glycoprotein n=1 Tax=Halorussus gelatinilyticus TaxID=2937524 RepID=A0A8U0II56_9EURY|nr:hypothetical protein [Halorussus gelatinilyticus]UPV99768.1 hypothetical protein M0R88_14765 [Halorussus gelatinilyticus]